jgi:predicted GTPase
VAQLSDLRFKLFDTAGMETSVQSGSLLERARGLTAKLLSRSHLALFMVDARAGVSITLSRNECEYLRTECVNNSKNSVKSFQEGV